MLCYGLPMTATTAPAPVRRYTVASILALQDVIVFEGRDLRVTTVFETPAGIYATTEDVETGEREHWNLAPGEIVEVRA